jgi:uncharacterized protein (TIGR03066 family)
VFTATRHDFSAKTSQIASYKKLKVAAGAGQEKKAINKEKIFGTWSLKPARPRDQDMTYEFTRDGKFRMAFSVAGRPRKLEGTYVVSGDSLRLTLKGSTAVERQRLKTLTEKEMVWENGTETSEFTRVK